MHLTLFMMTSSNGNIFRVTGHLCGEFTGPGEFPAQRPVTRSFDVFFHLHLNKQLSKQPRRWWFETPPWSLWRQRNDSQLSQHGGYRRPASLQWRHNGRDSVSNYQPHHFYSTVYSGADQRKHRNSAYLAFVWGIHRWPMNSPYTWPVTRKWFHLMTSSCKTTMVVYLRYRVDVLFVVNTNKLLNNQSSCGDLRHYVVNTNKLLNNQSSCGDLRH